MIELEIFLDNGSRITTPRVEGIDIDQIFKSFAEGMDVAIQYDGKSVFFVKGANVVAVNVLYGED